LKKHLITHVQVK